MFSKEVYLERFVNDRLLNAPGRSDIALIRSHDIQKVGHGIRLKIEFKVSKTADTACELGVNILMYRQKTI